MQEKPQPVFPIFLFLPTYPSNLALTMIIQIKMKSNAHPTRYTPTGLEFSDGTELPADVIVFTTGFVGNMRHNISALVSPEVESQLEDLWGLDAEGELLGAFKYSGRELFLSFYSLSFRFLTSVGLLRTHFLALCPWNSMVLLSPYLLVAILSLYIRFSQRR